MKLSPMKNVIRTISAGVCVLSLLLAASRTSAQTTTLTFDDVTSLTDYAPLGVTFSAKASIWSSGSTPSVLTSPDGGTYSVPNGLQFGNAGGVLGSIFFAHDAGPVSIWALSGPGPDLLSSPMYIRAFDALGNQVGEDNVNSSLQFDLLSITEPNIRRLDLFSADVGDDVWDNLTFTSVPEPSAACLVFSAGVAFIFWRRFATTT